MHFKHVKCVYSLISVYTDFDQTHPNKLIKVFSIARMLQAGEFDQGWS